MKHQTESNQRRRKPRMDKSEKGLFRLVYVSVWSDGTFTGLDDAARLLFQALLQDDGVIPGVVIKGKGALNDQLGWDDQPGKLDAAFSQLERKGLAKADWRNRLVWFPPQLHHNPPANQNMILGWKLFWAPVPDCPLKDEIHQALFAHVQERRDGADRGPKSKSWVAAFEEAMGTVTETVSQTVTQTLPETPPQTSNSNSSSKSTRSSSTGGVLRTSTPPDPPRVSAGSAADLGPAPDTLGDQDEEDIPPGETIVPGDSANTSAAPVNTIADPAFDETPPSTRAASLGDEPWRRLTPAAAAAYAELKGLLS